MKKYQFAYIFGFNHKFSVLGSSDPKLIQDIFEKLQKIFPDSRLVVQESDLDNNPTECHFDKLKGKDKETNYWILQELLSLGWEPFETYTDSNRYLQRIFLRLEINE